MIGIVIVTHNNIAVELIRALEHIIGKQDAIAAVCIGPDDNMDDRRQEVIQKTETVDSGKGVILLTDMFGGTPSNLAISVLKRTNVEVITGVNLPMLIRLASIRKKSTLAGAVSAAQEAGKKYINAASKLLAESDH